MSKIFPIALLTFIVIAIGYVVWGVFTSDELNSKPEWSFLQNLEYLHRNEALREMEFGTNEGFVAICVLGKEKPRIWILLNPKAEPFYKQLPEGEFTLSQRNFDTIKNRTDVQPKVLKQLSKHVVLEH